MTTLAPTFRALLVAAATSAVLANVSPLRAADGGAKLSSHFSAADRADATAASTAQTPFTREQLMAELTRSIGSHFNLEGDLQLELLRAWTPPARVATV